MMIRIPKNFKAKNFTTGDIESKKAFQLLRRVYNIIEKSHLNDGKLLKNYIQKFEIPRNLGDSIYNFLQTKDEYFIQNVIRRQKNYRKKIKNKI